MKKMYKKPLQIIAIVFVTICMISTFVSASSVSSLQSQKDDLSSELEDNQSALSDNQAAQSDAQDQLDTINAKLDDVQSELDKVNSDLQTAQDNLATQQSEYNDIQAQLKQSQAELCDRVNAIYKNGNVSYLDVLFSADSIQDFISSCAFLGKIVDQDQSTIDSINANEKLAEEKLNELEQTRNQIATLQSQKESEEAEYTQQASAKQDLLDQLGSEEDELQSEISEEQSQMADIEAQIKSYYASQAATSSTSSPSGSATTANNSGTFAWPLSIAGTITSGFGYRSNPLGSGSEFHPGLDIGAPKGTPVLAAESGTVIISQMNSTGGYGNYIVIDHGGSVCTLYGHMSALYVSKGATVSRGQQIGAVGSTGRSTGNHLHFGVLVNGSPVSPLNYVSQP